MKTTWGLFLAPLLLTGCVSVLPEPVIPDGLYRLEPEEDIGPVEKITLPVDISIYEPDGPVLLLSENFVFEDDDGSLSLLKAAQWSDDAARLLQIRLLERLSKLSPDSEGVAVSERAGARTGAELRWQVQNFVIRDDSAVVKLQATVLSARRRTVIGQFPVVVKEPYSGQASREGVQALIRAARQAADEVAVKLPEYLYEIELKAESSNK